jgi:hypothetical protein
MLTHKGRRKNGGHTMIPNGRTVVIAGCMAFAAVQSWAQPAVTISAPGDDPKVIHTTLPNANANANANAGTKAASSFPIQWHGGPVLHGTTKTYFIWYGNWTGNTATSILETLASSIGGSPYFNINTTYYDGSQHVANSVSLGAFTTDNYSLGSNLSDANIKTIVTNAISSGVVPNDTNGVYFVLTSEDVNETSGFCTQYCGWHTHGTISGSDIKYAFVGNPARCPSACQAQPMVNGAYVSPNNNVGADGMASIVAHELEESVTDPDLNAWYDKRGAENADKCAWTFGTVAKLANGSYTNVTMGGLNFLIQQNWVNASPTNQYCAMSR